MPSRGDSVMVCKHSSDRPVRWWRVDPPGEARHQETGELVGTFAWLGVCDECASEPGAPIAQAVDFATLAEDIPTVPTGRRRVISVGAGDN